MNCQHALDALAAVALPCLCHDSAVHEHLAQERHGCCSQGDSRRDFAMPLPCAHLGHAEQAPRLQAQKQVLRAQEGQAQGHGLI